MAWARPVRNLMAALAGGVARLWFDGLRSDQRRRLADGGEELPEHALQRTR